MRRSAFEGVWRDLGEVSSTYFASVAALNFEQTEMFKRHIGAHSV
jgi:hypothetical protein